MGDEGSYDHKHIKYEDIHAHKMSTSVTYLSNKPEIYRYHNLIKYTCRFVFEQRNKQGSQTHNHPFSILYI